MVMGSYWMYCCRNCVYGTSAEDPSVCCDGYPQHVLLQKLCIRHLCRGSLCMLWWLPTACIAADTVYTAPLPRIPLYVVMVTHCMYCCRHCVYGTSAEGGLWFNWPLPAGLLAVCFTAFIGWVARSGYRKCGRTWRLRVESVKWNWF